MHLEHAKSMGTVQDNLVGLTIIKHCRSINTEMYVILKPFV